MKQFPPGDLIKYCESESDYKMMSICYLKSLSYPPSPSRPEGTYGYFLVITELVDNRNLVQMSSTC